MKMPHPAGERISRSASRRVYLVHPDTEILILQCIVDAILECDMDVEIADGIATVWGHDEDLDKMERWRPVAEAFHSRERVAVQISICTESEGRA